MGTAAELVLDLISDSAAADSMTVTSFAHDGRVSTARFAGGPAYGELFGNPLGATVIGNEEFRNALAVPFDSLGSSVSFTLTIPQMASPSLGVFDAVSFYWLRDDTTVAITSADPLGANALFALGVTGAAGGNLDVFSPMQFVAPDTLAIDLTTVGVPEGPIATGRLRMRSAAPNPSPGAVELAIEVPSPGGSLRVQVFDVAGRLVAEPYRKATLAGPLVVRWSGRVNGGHLAPGGVYIIQAEFSGQSVVRRVVLVR